MAAFTADNHMQSILEDGKEHERVLLQLAQEWASGQNFSDGKRMVCSFIGVPGSGKSTFLAMLKLVLNAAGISCADCTLDEMPGQYVPANTIQEAEIPEDTPIWKCSRDVRLSVAKSNMLEEAAKAKQADASVPNLEVLQSVAILDPTKFRVNIPAMLDKAIDLYNNGVQVLFFGNCGLNPHDHSFGLALADHLKCEFRFIVQGQDFAQELNDENFTQILIPRIQARSFQQNGRYFPVAMLPKMLAGFEKVKRKLADPDAFRQEIRDQQQYKDALLKVSESLTLVPLSLADHKAAIQKSIDQEISRLETDISAKKEALSELSKKEKKKSPLKKEIKELEQRMKKLRNPVYQHQFLLQKLIDSSRTTIEELYPVVMQALMNAYKTTSKSQLFVKTVKELLPQKVIELLPLFRAEESTRFWSNEVSGKGRLVDLCRSLTHKAETVGYVLTFLASRPDDKEVNKNSSYFTKLLHAFLLQQRLPSFVEEVSPDLSQYKNIGGKSKLNDFSDNELQMHLLWHNQEEKEAIIAEVGVEPRHSKKEQEVRTFAAQVEFFVAQKLKAAASKLEKENCLTCLFFESAHDNQGECDLVILFVDNDMVLKEIWFTETASFTEVGKEEHDAAKISEKRVFFEKLGLSCCLFTCALDEEKKFLTITEHGQGVLEENTFPFKETDQKFEGVPLGSGTPKISGCIPENAKYYLSTTEKCGDHSFSCIHYVDENLRVHMEHLVHLSSAKSLMKPDVDSDRFWMITLGSNQVFRNYNKVNGSKPRLLGNWEAVVDCHTTLQTQLDEHRAAAEQYS